MKKMTIMSLFALLVVMTSCGNSKQDSAAPTAASEEKNDVTFPKEFKQTVDGIDFDTTIHIPENVSLSNLKKSSAELQLIDMEKAKKEFIGEKKLEREDVYDLASPVMKNEKLFFYKCEDGTELSVSPLSLNMVLMSKMSHVNFNIDMNKDRFSQDTEMDFSTREDASKAVLKSASEFGINMKDDYNLTTFSLDHKTLEDVELHTDNDGNKLEDLYKTDWSSKDDMYFLSMRQTTQGLPVYFMVFDGQADVDESFAPITAYYSQDGLANLNVRNVYSFNKQDETVTFLSFDEVAKHVAESYGEIVGDETYAMKDATLYMMPIFNKKKQSYHVEPVWLFDVVHTMAERVVEGETIPSKTYDMHLIVNASTGDVIVSGYE